MAFVFKFPDVGEGIHEGTVVEWLVAEGDTVAEDQALVKVETDKAVVELPSPKAGVVLKLHFAPETSINVGDDLVVIGDAGEAVPEAQARRPRRPRPLQGSPVRAGRGDGSSPALRGGRWPRRAPELTRASSGSTWRRSPATGSGGRITDEDVERAARGEGAGTTCGGCNDRSACSGARHPRGGRRRAGGTSSAVTHLRKVIAGAMQRSKQTRCARDPRRRGRRHGSDGRLPRPQAADRSRKRASSSPSCLSSSRPSWRRSKTSRSSTPAVDEDAGEILHQEVLQHRNRGRHAGRTHRTGDQER